MMKKVFLITILLSLSNQVFANTNVDAQTETAIFLINKADELDDLDKKLMTYANNLKNQNITPEERQNNICKFRNVAEKKISVLNEVTEKTEVKNDKELNQSFINKREELREIVKNLNGICTNK